jgi:two-component system phosphate regulon response regulator OmpR
MRTILCVDDHRATLWTLALILRNEGYRCLTAENREEADLRFAGNAVDLVIVDHGLPGITGDLLAAHLKKIRPVHVMMLSGPIELDSLPKSVDLLLIKPQNPVDLFAAISKLLNSGPPKAEPRMNASRAAALGYSTTS